MSLSFTTKAIDLNGIPQKIVLQNENGPCALVALVNVLLLSSRNNTDPFVQQLVNLINSNNTVGLQELNQMLANIALQSQSAHHTSDADINEVINILPQLHTGLNINPKFNGSFQDGLEMALFRSFHVGIVHGWIADPQQGYEDCALYSYDDAQKLLVQAYEMNQGTVAKDDQVVANGSLMRSFLARSASQLTDCGLRYLKQIMLPQSFCVLFRNDHFSTLYKHKDELFILVTDMGFASRKDIVWQSLSSVTGQDDLFFTGDFIPVSQHEPQTHSRSNNPFEDEEAFPEHPAGVTDEEYARALQEEEDARVARNLQQTYERTQQRQQTQRVEKKSAKDKKKKKRKCSIL